MDKLNLYHDNGICWKEGNKEFLLRATEAEYPDNPRDSGLNVGHMTCWHNRYRLGDHHEYERPIDLWLELAHKYVATKDLIAALESGEFVITVKPAKGAKAKTPMWAIYGHDGAELYEAISKDDLLDVACEELSFRNLQTLLDSYVVALPLWLYDHSGITMSCGARTGQYADRWDSGQVGWIWVTKQEVLEDFPNANEDNWKQTAQEVLEAEVELYDQYLTGDVYDYRLYQRENGRWEELDDYVDGGFGSDIFSNGCLENLENYGCKNIREALQNGSCTVGHVDTETVTMVVGIH